MASTVKHYRIDKGTPCEVLQPGESKWMPHVMRKRLWHVERVDDGGKWVFEMGAFRLRVESGLVRGSAARFATPLAIPDEVLHGAQEEAKPEPVSAAGEIVLTKELLNAGRNGDGWFNKQQAAMFGITLPPQRGWLESLVGLRVTREFYEWFLSLKKKLPPK
jgi:hypothetical protein